MHSSQTISRKTTGSVEARTAPPMKAKIQPKFKNSPNGRAPIAMIKPVPDPSISAGTNQRLPNSATWSLTASKNSTEAKSGWPRPLGTENGGYVQLIETAASQ